MIDALGWFTRSRRGEDTCIKLTSTHTLATMLMSSWILLISDAWHNWLVTANEASFTCCVFGGDTTQWPTREDSMAHDGSLTRSKDDHEECPWGHAWRRKGGERRKKEKLPCSHLHQNWMLLAFTWWEWLFPSLSLSLSLSPSLSQLNWHCNASESLQSRESRQKEKNP